MINKQEIDYEQVLLVLNEIKEYFDFPQFARDFGSNAESMRKVVNATIEAVSKNEDEKLIKKSLRIIRDVATNAAGGVISSGIIALLSSISIG